MKSKKTSGRNSQVFFFLGEASYGQIVNAAGTDELPPPYTSISGGIPMVTCRVCQVMNVNSYGWQTKTCFNTRSSEMGLSTPHGGGGAKTQPPSYQWFSDKTAQLQNCNFSWYVFFCLKGGKKFKSQWKQWSMHRTPYSHRRGPKIFSPPFRQKKMSPEK